ncbi:hypothetical protein NEHOM01_0900 [Nematocida homosporus]|uniref:uncharacterized protein n=1 Tax=Nematocida homosporus TaxID=1912981 RepID=UPI00221F2589|nr:uncharacterized protein NEHOM01_0900 [Nematocida homosporus]KAI5185541.1 hypothetical protein NEHOM01_0900 [Nematocida homosporus]
MLYQLFFLLTSLTGWLAFFFQREKTLHGRNLAKQGIHKDAFIFFYLNGLLWAFFLALRHSITGSARLMIIHLLRRTFESALYSYNCKSKMSRIHWIGGLLYYPLIVARSFNNDHPLPSLFVLASLGQAISHYLLFRKGRFTYYTHYLCESLIHYSIVQDITHVTWITTFSLINAINRTFK